MSLTSLKTMEADVNVGVRPARMPVSTTVEAVALVLNLLHVRWPSNVNVPLLKCLLPPLLLEIEVEPNRALRRSTMDPAGSTKVASELLAPHRATASANGCPSTRCQDWALQHRAAMLTSRDTKNAAGQIAAGSRPSIRALSRRAREWASILALRSRCPPVLVGG